jgi:hypothetical protein
MGRLLADGADGNVGCHSVNALAANAPRLRGGDIRHLLHERSPGRVMSPAAHGRTRDDFLALGVPGSERRISQAEGATPASPSIACQVGRSAAVRHLHHSITAQ